MVGHVETVSWNTSYVYPTRRWSVAWSQIEDRAPIRDPSDDVLSHARALPAEGHYARIQLGYAYSNVRAFPHSISPERGFSAAFALEGLAQGLGSDYDQIVFSAEARGYLSIPWEPRWLKNHVLAGRAALRLSGGPDLADLSRLGGVTGQSVVTTSTQDLFPLRGLRTAGLAGAGLLAGSLEYRAPIIRIERGLWTLPVTLRVLHAAVYADAGRVFDRLDPSTLRDGFFDDFAVSAGAELRADVILWYSLGLSLRLGYAKLLHTPRADLDQSGIYFQIGSAF